LACAECEDSLPFSGASFIPLCYIPFPSALFHQPVFHPTSLHLAIYFLVYLSILFLPNSYIILFWEFYFLQFSVHAQTNVIYVFNLIASIIVSFSNTAWIFYGLIFSNFLFHYEWYTSDMKTCEPLSSNFCYITLKTEAVVASDMFITIYQSSWPHIQEGTSTTSYMTASNSRQKEPHL
jgi:hypothetical protein